MSDRLSRDRFRSRRFENPYFRRTKRGDRKGWLVGLCVLLAVMGILGAAGYVFASSRFDIGDVSVEGCRTIPTDAVSAIVRSHMDERVLLVLHRRNRFLFDPAVVRTDIQAAFDLASLEISRDGGHVTVRLEEKVSRLVWKSADARFLVDRQGTVIRPIADGEDPSAGADRPLPMLLDVNRGAATVGTAVLTPDEVDGIFAFHEQLTRSGILFGTTRVDRLAGKWVSVDTADGYGILFDPLSDIQAQTDNLNAVLRDQVKDPSKLQYIDLRFEDHVYFK